MILYRTRHVGVNAHHGHSIYTRRPADVPEQVTIAIDLGHIDFEIGGPDDHPCMLFDCDGHGYAATYDKHKRQIVLTDVSGNVARRFSVAGLETEL